ncbi:MAG: Cna B-type domain-containing protein [Anaerovoracaceae bacterium]|jgi:hypothetical protein
MKRKRVILSIIMSFLMVFCFSAPFAAAGTADGSVTNSGTTNDISVSSTGAIYLNGSRGSDSNDGSTPETAVKTFEKAKALATSDQSITTIYVSGKTSLSGDVSLEGTNAVIKRYKSYYDFMFDIDNATVTMHDITIDGNSEEATQTIASMIWVTNGSTLNINEGTVLQNNKFYDYGEIYYDSAGGALRADDSTVNMSAGVIQNNSACIGGGVSLSHATMNMTGGTIQNNTATNTSYKGLDGSGCGGGICAWTINYTYGAGGTTTINLSGGTIDNNTSEGSGGGISLGDQNVSDKAVLNMTGGTISNNTSHDCGGGIFVQASGTGQQAIANISAGKIIDNHMVGGGRQNPTFGGGGIYVNGYSPTYTTIANGELHLTNAIITDNSAEIAGGGYAACPVTKTHIYVKNGVALAENTAPVAKDLYILASTAYGIHSGDPTYTIADSMLGGAPYNWKNEEGNEVDHSRLEGTLNGFSQEELKLHTDQKVDSSAEDLAKVWITGNTSTTRGGGVGSNGTVYMGEYDTTSMNVDKQWDDNNNADQARPDKVKIELYRTIEGSTADPIYVSYSTMTPDKDGNWKLAFTNLPKADADGNTYIYTVKESNVDGYAGTVTGDQNTGYTVTNSPAVDIAGTKTWDDQDDQDGIRPDSITIDLFADGAKIDSRKVTSKDDWAYAFNDLPKYDNNDGHQIEYTIAEEAVDNYTTTYDGYNITNKYVPKKTSINVSKSWLDGDNADKDRPDSVTIHLLANGEDTGKTLTLNEANKWAGSFTDLPVNKAGEKIEYTITEDSADHYQAAIDGNADDGFTITNTDTTKIKVTGTKTWDDQDDQDGIRPDSITVNLLADGTKIDSKKVTSKDDWAYAFNDLPKFDSKDGHQIAYTITEDAVDNYSTSYDGNDITNEYTPGKTSVTVSKSWLDGDNAGKDRPDSVTIHLLANGEDTGNTLTLNEKNQWTGSFTDLPINKAGEKIEYTIKEDAVDHYKSDISGNADDGFTITNTNTTTTEVTGTKTWDDQDDQDGIRPDSITVNLLADGTRIDSKQVTSKDDWAYEFNDLPRFDSKDGHQIVYTVTEEAVDKYSTSYDGNNITNKYTPVKTEISVLKVWNDKNDKDGVRPDSVTVHLFADGKDTGRTLELNASNDWKGTFKDLAVNNDGKAITYTVTETPVAKYTTYITGSAAEGFKITNIHEVTTPPTNPKKPPTTTTTTTKTTTYSQPNPSSPKTGDPTDMNIYLVIMAIAGAAAAFGSIRKRSAR